MEFKNLNVQIKAIDDKSYTLKAVFSTADVDRHGEIVDQKSWILDEYEKNPVVLFSHDHHQPPVGRIKNLVVRNGSLEGEVEFAAEQYEFANTLWKLYRDGFMRAFSVGFSPEDVEVENGRRVLKNNHLFEVSTVSVPANAMALAKSKGIDVAPLEDKFVEMGEAEDAAAKDNVEKGDCPGCAPLKQDEPEEIVTPEETPVETIETTTEPEEVIDEPSSDTEIVPEEKAASLTEVATDIEERQQKADNFRKVEQIFWAFYEVYFSMDVQADEFDSLLAEFVDLLQGIETKGKLSGKQVDVKAIGIDFILEKAGRVLSAANRAKVEDAISALTDVIEADDAKTKPTEDTPEEKKTISLDVTVPTFKTSKKRMRNREINKAIRHLLQYKK